MKDMISLLIDGKLSFAHLVTLIVMLLPSICAYALPFGFVTATLLTLGSLSADREYIALRGAGISPLKIFSPLLFVASCGVLLSIAVNFHYAPLAISKVKQKIQNTIKEDPLRFIAPKQFIRDFPGYILYVDEINDQKLSGFRIWELNEAGDMQTFIDARDGNLIYDAAKNALQLTLNNGSVERREEGHKNWPLILFEKLTLDLSLAKIFKNDTVKKKLHNMTYAELMTLKTQAKKNHDTSSLMSIQVELQMKGALAFGVLALMLMAIPLSIRFSRRETSINAVIALMICVGYYFLMILISFLEKRPHARPDLLLWVPNLLLQIWGIRGIWRLCRR